MNTTMYKTNFIGILGELVIKVIDREPFKNKGDKHHKLVSIAKTVQKIIEPTEVEFQSDFAKKLFFDLKENVFPNIVEVEIEVVGHNFSVKYENSDCQLSPKKGDVKVLDLVLNDLKKRDKLGQKKYGTSLMINNGRDSLQDAYEEILDLTMYLRQRLEEAKENDG
jgi:hypothetical protein